ncbi:unannotated protein [freshwater metagenome]|uniref:Unannotated protein n=1 Tax=freshwater metagenome TaxID=449393 RepID=A0A6J7EP20_9ZZZZ
MDDRYRHDPPWRGGLDLRDARAEYRCIGRRSLCSPHRRGARDHSDDTASAALEGNPYEDRPLPDRRASAHRRPRGRLVRCPQRISRPERRTPSERLVGTRARGGSTRRRESTERAPARVVLPAPNTTGCVGLAEHATLHCAAPSREPTVLEVPRDARHPRASDPRGLRSPPGQTCGPLRARPPAGPALPHRRQTHRTGSGRCR